MEVSRQLDWLSFSLKTNEHPSVLFPLCQWRHVGKGAHGYRAAYEDRTTGARCELDSADPDMGTHYQLSGDALSSYRHEFGATDDALSSYIARAGGRASRIDLTINLHNGRMTPRSVYNALRKGDLHAKADTFRFIEGKRANVEGDTLYIGAPKSDRQFRCYNKASELGIVDGGAWVRLELELRRIRANAAFQSCSSNGVSETVSGHVRDFITWKNAEFLSSLSDSDISPADIPRKATNRQRWLLGQVSQALAKELIIDYDFRHKFDASVVGALELLRSTEYNRACKRDGE